jgi:hypothetical protein
MSRQLWPVLPAIARRVAKTAPYVGCTCPEPDVRWDREAECAVVVHASPCPLTPLSAEYVERGEA